MSAVVIPVKSLAGAKHRLAGVLGDAGRRALVRAMLVDVLNCVHASASVTEVFVVTGDSGIAALAADRGAEHIAEPSPGGLNAAVSRAARHLEAIGRISMLVLPGDVPLVTPAEIDAFLSAARGHDVTIAGDHAGEGTNALYLSPPSILAPAFGAGSFNAHLAAARDLGLSARCCAFDGLAHDIDEGPDLARLQRRKADASDYAFLRHVNTPDGSSPGKPEERRHA